MFKKIDDIPEYQLINQMLYQLLEEFYSQWPCENIWLFQYSNLNQTFNSIYQYEYPDIHSNSKFLNVRTNSIYTKKAIKENKIVYVGGNEIELSITNPELLSSSPAKNMLIVPISMNQVILGALVCLNLEFELTKKDKKAIVIFTRNYSYKLTNLTKTDENIFTNRELEIMQSIANGSSTREVSEELYISESTVKYFVNSVMKKTDSENRTEAVAKLMRSSFIQ